MRLNTVPWPILLVAALGACSGGGGGRTSGSASDSTSLSGTGGTATAGTESASGTAGGTATGSGSGTTGPTCDPNMCEGVCAGGACCDPELACADACCNAGEVCSFGTCVVPGTDCIDATDCADGEYCEFTLGMEGGGGTGGGTGGMCMGGVEPDTGKCLPKPPECPPGQEPGEPPSCIAKCEVVPEGTFAPELKFSWTGGNPMMTPIVIELDDDDCNGVVDARDIPEIVFATFDGSAYNNDGTLRAISIVGGAVVDKWSVKPTTDPIHPGRSIAGGNIDGQPGNEIVTCTDNGKVRAFAADGSTLWVSTYAGGCFMPSIADFDQDGLPEVLVQGAVLDGATGAIESTFPAMYSVGAADLDGDGFLEIFGPGAAIESDGTPIADTGLVAHHPAVADLDGDGRPEIVTMEFTGHAFHIWHLDPNMAGGFEIVRQGIDINGPLSSDLCPPGSSGNTKGGGPPTIADFNGDGTPDVGVAGGVGYAVFDGVKLMDPNVPNAMTNLWITQTTDCSSAQTGSAVFDFDGNGSAEVVYSDEQHLRIYRGTDGMVLWETCNTTGTLFEYPVIADVDNDGAADIVAVSNDYSSITCSGTKQRGVRVFGDSQGRWVRTRRIWNQHPYHVTNVAEDGTIPSVEAANWTQTGLNNYRQNVQPQGEFSAPDLVASVGPWCEGGEYGLVATVRNIGQAAVPAGVPVGFYAGDPMGGGTLLGTMDTTRQLYSLEAEDLVLLLPNAPAGVQDGSTPVFVVVDDGMPPHPWVECRTDNNVAEGTGKCFVAG